MNATEVIEAINNKQTVQSREIHNDIWYDYVGKLRDLTAYELHIRQWRIKPVPVKIKEIVYASDCCYKLLQSGHLSVTEGGLLNMLYNSQIVTSRDEKHNMPISVTIEDANV
jgi:hypothetical protein